ncbi:MAG TPA: hypothetical protein VFR37_04395 [Longimicrobium sp.]|nr:hypothetical protein [Longimicrobium sp.]
MRCIPLLFALLLASPVSAATQEYIGVGETVFGELTEDDPTLATGQYHDVWRFPTVVGTTYLITLRSEDFDAYLLAGPPGGTDCDPCEEDDDGALGTDAQLSIQVRNRETYVILVTAFNVGETGQYTLEVQEMVMTEESPVVVPATDTVMAMPTTGDLVPGTEVEEWLTGQDPVAADGAYEDTWVLRAVAGEPVTISMRSDDFDTVLRVGWWVDGRWEELAHDDDGGDGTNSRLTFTAPRDDEYLVRASSFDEGEEGAYTIMAIGANPIDTLGLPMILQAGEPAFGTLEEGDAMEGDATLVDVWEYAGHEGETITIEMASGDFDTFLRVRVMREDGRWDELGADDDGGSGTDSELTLTLPRNATYAIHANALEPETGGEYTLIVRRH